MKKRNFHIFLGLLVTMLFAINLWIFFHRNEGYAFNEELSYDQLYQGASQTRVFELTLVSKDTLELELNDSPQSSQWRILVPGGGSYTCSSKPRIKLEPGKNVYSLLNLTKPDHSPIELGINFTPSEIYAQSGRTKESVVELYSANVPVGEYPLHVISDWLQYTEKNSGMEVAEARKLLAEEAGFLQGEPDEIKVEKTAAFVLKHLDRICGIPTDTMDLLSPLKRFMYAKMGQSAVWCGDQSDILSFFLNAEGIPTRLVSMGTKVGKIDKAAHVFCEVYLKETQQWGIVDLTSKAIFISNENKHIFNTIDLFNSHFSCKDNLKVRFWNGQTICDTNYQALKPFYDYYFNPGTQFRFYFNKQFTERSFSFFSKLYRYFLPSPTFATFGGTDETNNEKFFLKQLAAVSLLLCGLLWFTSLALEHRSK